MPDTSKPNTPAQPTHWLARQFNLPLPILQAPMAGTQDHVLALAVAMTLPASTKALTTGNLQCGAPFSMRQ